MIWRVRVERTRAAQQGGIQSTDVGGWSTAGLEINQQVDNEERREQQGRLHNHAGRGTAWVSRRLQCDSVSSLGDDTVISHRIQWRLSARPLDRKAGD